MYDAVSIANYFVNLGIIIGLPITHTSLQRLLFFAQGLHLAITGKALFKDQIEAWPLGPVIPAVWDKYQKFGAEPINQSQPVGESLITTEDLKILGIVWEAIKNVKPAKLANWTHGEKSPWMRAFTPSYSRQIISHDSIKEYFRNEFDIKIDDKQPIVK